MDGPDRRQTWVAYAYLSVCGFYLYAVGALTPYLRDGLGLSAAQAALHPSAMAVGMVSAGTVADRVEQWLGRRGAALLALGILVAGAAAVASAVALPITLAGAFGIGLGCGAILSTVNQVLGRPGGIGAAVRFARANTWSMLASLFAPVSIAALATSTLGWRAVPLLPLAAAVVLEVAGGLSREGRSTVVPGLPVARPADPPLPRPFWTAWLFVIAAVSIEFSYVVWGSSVVAARTGTTLETATALASLFLFGMLAGRAALSSGVLARLRTDRVIAGALGTVAGGGVLVWLSGLPAVSGLGLLMAGLGTSALYPLGMATALGIAGGAARTAGARLTLASGLAILAAPLVLGTVADLLGVVSGWPAVIALCGVALLLRRRTAT